MGAMRIRYGILLAVRKAIRDNTPDLAEELDLDSRTDVSELVRFLIDLSGHPNPERQNAIVAMSEVSSSSPAIAVEVEQALVCLISDPDEAVRLAAVEAIGRRGAGVSASTLQALIHSKLREPYDIDEVLLSTLESLRKCASVRAAQAVPDLVKILTDTQRSMEVRISVCRTLGGLGNDALMAVPALLQIATRTSGEKDELSLTQASATAIVGIDADGALVYKTAKSTMELESLYNTLTLISGGAIDLFMQVLNQQIAQLKTGGHQLMRMKDLVTRVFGPTPAHLGTAARKKWEDTRRKKILNWIKVKKLPGKNVSRGYYEVDVAALESLRQLEQNNDH